MPLPDPRLIVRVVAYAGLLLPLWFFCGWCLTHPLPASVPFLGWALCVLLCTAGLWFACRDYRSVRAEIDYERWHVRRECRCGYELGRLTRCPECGRSAPTL